MSTNPYQWSPSDREEDRPPRPAPSPQPFAQPYAPPYPPQPAPSQPYSPHPHATQPYASQPYASQPYVTQPYGGPPFTAGYAAPRPDLADWGWRVLAMCIDSALLLVPYTIAFAYAMVTAEPPTEPFDDPSPTAAGGLALVLGFAWFVGVWVWNRIVRQGRTGRSLGKSAVGIRLVHEHTGQPVGAGAAFLRELAHNLDGFAYIGYLWPLWDERRQTFADKLCRTVVVRG